MTLGWYFGILIVSALVLFLLYVWQWYAYTGSPEGLGRLRILTERLGVLVPDTHANIMRRARMMRRQLSLWARHMGWFYDNTPRWSRLLLWWVAFCLTTTSVYYVTNAAREFFDTRSEWQQHVEEARGMARRERNAYLQVPPSMLEPGFRTAVERVNANPHHGFVRHPRTGISWVPGVVCAILGLICIIGFVTSFGDEIADIGDALERGGERVWDLLRPAAGTVAGHAAAAAVPAGGAAVGHRIGNGLFGFAWHVLADIVADIIRSLFTRH